MMNSQHRIEILQVFEGELRDASSIQQLLVEFDIPAFLFQEKTGNGLRSVILPATDADAVAVMVSDEYYDRSLKLIAEYKHNDPSRAE